MENMKMIVPIVVIVLIIGAVAGYFLFYADDDEEDDEGELTGTAYYEGTWEGSTEDMGDIDGTWEFEVNFDEEDVDGFFEGDVEGDIDGSVSDGELEADGDAAFGTVEWSGEFTDDGELVDGTWTYVDGEGSGTWEGTEEDDDDDEEEPTGENWNGFQFEEEIVADETTESAFLQAQETLQENGEEIGKLKGFTYEHTYREDGSEKSFEIETTYEGETETEIKVERVDLSGDLPESDVESFDLEVYELVHHVEVLQDDEGEDHPEWIELTVYLPTEEFHTEEVDSPDEYDVPDFSDFLIYAKAEYDDSDDNQAMISYYLNETMQNEMQEDDYIFYGPYMEGEMGDYDNYILYGLYGLGWHWFEGFTGEYGFEEGSWSISSPEDDDDSLSVEIKESTEEFSEYIFTSYNVTLDVVTGEGDAKLEGSFIPSLPVPVYLQVGDETSSYEMELTDLEFEDVGEEYELTINAEEGGTTDPEPDTHTHYEGDEVTVEAIPDSGWEFSHWEGDHPDGESEEEVITIGMDTHKTVTAHFEELELEEYELTIQIEGEGTVEVDGDEVDEGWTETYDEGKEVNLEAIADEGWEFIGWTEDDDSLSADENIDIEMNEDRTITAYFSPDG